MLPTIFAFEPILYGPKRKVPQYDHIVVVIEENKSFDSVINQPDAPYFNYLAQNGALFTHSYHSQHPSQPNYLTLFSGQSHDIHDNLVHPKINAPNLFTALNTVGKSFLCFSEDLPSPGYDGKYYRHYVRKHNPSTQFTNVPDWVNLPFTYFPQDFEKLPSVCFVIPNMINNAHDGSIAQADQWLEQNFSRYSQWAIENNSLLIVTFDEPEKDNFQKNIPTIFYGANIQPGQYKDYIDHFSVLKFILKSNQAGKHLPIARNFVRHLPSSMFKDSSV